jgi:hypothetical protein
MNRLKVRLCFFEDIFLVINLVIATSLVFNSENDIERNIKM